jgi:PhzF family phenazine biosynthesis protein
LEEWLPDNTMQAIAMENNLSETAFFVPAENRFNIRWFTPNTEVDLCGHATLASAFVIFNILKYDKEKIEFDSRSGKLIATRNGELLTLDFPAQPPKVCDMPEDVANIFEVKPIISLKFEDHIFVFEKEEDIVSANPNLLELKRLEGRGVIITARSTNYDFVVRCFFPAIGIDEDPVTGSAYTQLAPFWSEKLGKNTFTAKQLSERGGELLVELKGDRVFISGKAVKYFEGQIEI